ncbi:hypothetical protein B0H11DRAFT_2241694 [Mycena galericulata]|nr:hypothetical protein B0H11DRAFT_2241694 [Mycena galericulata]
MYDRSTSNTVETLTKDLALQGHAEVIHALLFATGHPHPISVTLPVKTEGEGQRVLGFKDWFGNIIIVGCDDYIGNPESLSSNDGEFARDAVMSVVRGSLKEMVWEEE